MGSPSSPPPHAEPAAATKPEAARSGSDPAIQSGKRFGTFGGVFTPSILTILGVVMYLRFGWVVGHAGLAGALVIVLISHVISGTTALSISSISTNRTVGAGGAYYIISRSLGAPAGAAIGIPLFLGQALSVSFYVVGFVETLEGLWPDLPSRWVGIGVCLLLSTLSLKSADLALKIQYVVMAAIGISLVSFGLGVRPEAPPSIQWSAPEGSASFGVVFAVFFPAVTGIMAGLGMSGDLKDPRKSLPRGTLLAVLWPTMAWRRDFWVKARDPTTSHAWPSSRLSSSLLGAFWWAISTSSPECSRCSSWRLTGSPTWPVAWNGSPPAPVFVRDSRSLRP